MMTCQDVDGKSTVEDGYCVCQGVIDEARFNAIMY